MKYMIIYRIDYGTWHRWSGKRVYYKSQTEAQHHADQLQKMSQDGGKVWEFDIVGI